jgi:hypothetical protein
MQQRKRFESTANHYASCLLDLPAKTGPRVPRPRRRNLRPGQNAHVSPDGGRYGYGDVDIVIVYVDDVLERDQVAGSYEGAAGNAIQLSFRHLDRLRLGYLLAELVFRIFGQRRRAGGCEPDGGKKSSKPLH